MVSIPATAGKRPWAYPLSWFCHDPSMEFNWMVLNGPSIDGDVMYAPLNGDIIGDPYTVLLPAGSVCHDENFPHVCPNRGCGAPAYVGFLTVDCSRKCGKGRT